MILKIFYGVWRNVKWRKKKHKNPLLSANQQPQCTVNLPQTTIKKNPANPQTPSQQTQQTPLIHRKPTNTITAKKTTNPANPQTAAQIGKAQCEKAESHCAAQPPRREAQWPDRRSSSHRAAQPPLREAHRESRRSTASLRSPVTRSAKLVPSRCSTASSRSPPWSPVIRSAKVQCEKVERGGWVCAREKREGGGGLCEWVLENGLRKIFP